MGLLELPDALEHLDLWLRLLAEPLFLGAVPYHVRVFGSKNITCIRLPLG